jgi:hypothetical protein
MNNPNWCSLDYLVFSGGGPNGLLHLGALKFLDLFLHITKQESVFYHFKGFAGTSVGALLALMCVCGFKSDGMIEKIKDVLPELLNLNYSLFGFDQTHGLRDNAPLFQFVRSLLNFKPVTFESLYALTKKDFYVCTCDFQNCSIKIFDHKSSPKVNVALAVMASMSIPFVFPPIEIEGRLYVDGGCQLNLLVNVFPMDKTLSLWIREPSFECNKQELMSHFTTFSKQVIKTFFYAHDAVISSLYLPHWEAHFAILPAFTNGFFLQPIANIHEPIKAGSNSLANHFVKFSTGQERTSACFVGIILHLFTCLPQEFARWLLTTIVFYIIISESSLDDTRPKELLQGSAPSTFESSLQNSNVELQTEQ